VQVAALEFKNAIGNFSNRMVMRYNYKRPPMLFRYLLKQTEYFARGLRIEISGGFIGEY
jgi:hypothetical protein